MPKENNEQGQLNIPSFLLRPLADARKAQAAEEASDSKNTDKTLDDDADDAQSKLDADASSGVDEIDLDDDVAAQNDDSEYEEELDDSYDEWVEDDDADVESQMETDEGEESELEDYELESKDATADLEGKTDASEADETSATDSEGAVEAEVVTVETDVENNEADEVDAIESEVENVDVATDDEQFEDDASDDVPVEGNADEDAPTEDGVTNDTLAEDDTEAEEPVEEIEDDEDTGASEETSSPEDELDAMMKSVMQAVSITAAMPEPAEAKEQDKEKSEVAASTDAVTSDSSASLQKRIPDPAIRGHSEQDPKAESNSKEEGASKPKPKRRPKRRPRADSVSTQRPNRDPKRKARPTPEPKPNPKPTPAAPAKDKVEDDTPVPTLEEDLKTMRSVERRLFAHRYATLELDAFGASIDPSKATADRAEALAILAEEDHELLSAPEVEPALERLAARSAELTPTVAAQVNILTRDRNHLVRVPKNLNSKFVRLSSESYDAWVSARANNDWRSFAPYLDKLVNLKRKIATAQNPGAHPYDTLLDEFEPGTDREFYDSFFAQIKECIVPLLSAISMSGRKLSRSCVEGRFDQRRQWDLADDLCIIMGIDEDAHYLTSTEHPFSEAMTSNYAITAARIEYENVMGNVYTMLHELGHGLYEQGVDESLNRTSLKGGTSSGMHEAQARFFENYVGRDRSFMFPLLELLRYRFPGQMGRVTPNQLHRAVNSVMPSLIRVDADELTYPLHILVRYEIEQLLLGGEATAREVPKLWADRYESYVGIRPKDDTTGALQDVHWAMGEFGYFPAYALGNAYAAQLRAKMINDGIEWDKLLRAADLAPIRAWLKKRIWRHGRTKTAQELMQEACGEPFDAKYYTTYLSDKFGALYGLRRD